MRSHVTGTGQRNIGGGGASCHVATMLRRFVSCFLLAVLISVLSAAPAKPKPGPEVLVVADAPGEVPPEFRATPGKAVHYYLVGLAERSLGQPIAGEPQPDKAVLEREIEKALASQGYLRTRLGGVLPALALVVSWGSANLMIEDFEETNADSGETSTSSVVFNRREIAQLVGAIKAHRRLLSSSEADAINDAARQDRVYVFIGAFDAQALAKKQKKLLWRTAISIESRRTSLPENLGVMLASAAPWFGRDSEMPVFVDDAARRKAEVHIGTPVVVPDPPKEGTPVKK
jgi:hypothetical protein